MTVSSFYIPVVVLLFCVSPLLSAAGAGAAADCKTVLLIPSGNSDVSGGGVGGA